MANLSFMEYLIVGIASALVFTKLIGVLQTSPIDLQSLGVLIFFAFAIYKMATKNKKTKKKQY